MNLRLSLATLVLCTAGFLACTPSPSSTTGPLAGPVVTDTTVSSSEIRPNSKGQRLEYGEIEGDFIIPAGTSTFLVQAQPLALSPMSWLIGSPAWAAEEITDAQIRLFRARVDGESVEMNILAIQSTAAGERKVSYRIKQVPALEYTQLLEFYSPSETIQLKGIISQVQANQLTRLSEPVDLDTTAVLEAVGRDESTYIHQLSMEDIRTLAQKPEVQSFREFLKQELKRRENKAQKFSALTERFDIKGKVLPVLRTRLDALKARDLNQCKADPDKCRQRLLQCRPTPLKRCPRPDDILARLRSGSLRPSVLPSRPVIQLHR